MTIGTELLKRSFQDLVPINGGVHLLSILEEYTRSHLSPSKRPPKHHSSTSSTFSIIDAIRVELFIFPSPYPVPSAALHPHFYTHLICPNKCLPILHSKMSMALGKLETTFAVKILEKGLTSGYPMIIAKVFEGMFELSNADVKLEVLDN